MFSYEFLKISLSSFFNFHSTLVIPSSNWGLNFPSKSVFIKYQKVFANEGLLNFGNIKLKSRIINLNLSKKGNLNEAAVNFYHYLHKLDKSKCKRIAVVNIPNDGLGKTINDRLKRAIK